MPITAEQAETELKKRRATEELARRKQPDFGMIAVRRDKLPGVFDNPNKQLDQLLGDGNLDDLLPLDVRFDFGRVVGMTEKPDETRTKMELSLLYKSLADIPTRVSYRFMDEFNRVAFNKPIDVKKAMSEYKDYYSGAKTYVGVLKHGFRRAGVGMVKGLAGKVKLAGELTLPTPKARAKKVIFPQVRDWGIEQSEKLIGWGNDMGNAVDEYYRENKAEAIQILSGIGYRATLKEYITKPTNLVQGIIESSPLILEGILGNVFGGPAGAITMMSLPITGQVYADVRKEGTDVTPAFIQAVLTGTGEAAIEQWTLSRKLGLMKNYKAMVADGLPKILWEGTKAFFRGTAEEGTQELNRNIWQWLFTDRSQQWMANVKESMAAGGPIELAMAGAFSAAGYAGAPVTVAEQLDRVDKIQDAVKAEPTLTKEHKTEIVQELDKVKDDVKQDVYAPVEPEKPSEAVKKPPSKPVEPITKPKAVEVADMTLGELKKESTVFDKKIETEIARLDRIDPTRQILDDSGITHLSPEDASRMTEVNYEIGRRVSFSKQEASERIQIKRQLREKDIVFEKDETTENLKAKLAKPVEAEESIEKGISIERAKQLTGQDNPTASEIRRAFGKMEVSEQKIVIENVQAELQELQDEKKSLLQQRKEAFVPDKPLYTSRIRTTDKSIVGKKARLEEFKQQAQPPTETKAEPVKVAKPTQEKDTKLRQQIGAAVAQKGLTQKAVEELKKKHAGYRHLTGKVAKAKITTEQLQNLLKAVQKARPKQVGYKKVITKKTEKKIQTLKENLIKKTQMTEKHFDEILEKEIHGKEPKYIDAKNFITETQGKDIIRRTLDEAKIIKLTESFEQAIAKKPEIAKRVKLLDSRIEKAPKRDPYSLESMRYYNQQAEIKTGAPIFTAYMDLMDTHLEVTKTRTSNLKKIESTVSGFKDIAKDEVALQRVSDYIASQTALKQKPAMPKDITVNEIKLAKEIQKILKEYELPARFTRFYWWWSTGKQEGPHPLPDYDRYKTEINKAVDIYESKGEEELIEYLKTQKWGVVKSGYEPLEILFRKVIPYTPKATTVGKGHIKIRTDIEYHKQERNILQRLTAYMRQMDMLYNLSPKINAYIRLWDDNAAKFKDWGKVKNDIEIFLRNLKRYNIEGGFFERNIARAYSQAMRVIIMPSPVLSFRNLFQNAAFEHDKTILIDPRNTKLTDKDIEYLETYVLQTRAMVEEYFMVGEKPLFGLKTLTGLIDKVKIYPYSDIANRHWSFWAKTNQVDRALKAESIKQMMTEAKFEDMTELEQRRALAILARDGKEAMSQYIGRVHVDDIHFLYERSQRSPAEMTSLGKIVGNLMLFPRAYGEKLAHVANKTLKGKTSQEQWRGLKTLFAVIGGGLIVGSIYMKVTGRKRNPYNPLELLAFRPGGLAWGSIEAATEVYANILSAAKGDSRALAALTVAIPRAADMFIPFYDYSLRAIEAATDQKNIDRKALRQMRMMIDKEYKIRGGAYKVERTALEKWQYFLSGPSVDTKEKKTTGVTISIK